MYTKKLWIFLEFSEALHISRVDIVRKVSLEGEASDERRLYRVTVSLPLLHKEPGYFILYFCAAFFSIMTVYGAFCAETLPQTTVLSRGLNFGYCTIVVGSNERFVLSRKEKVQD